MKHADFEGKGHADVHCEECWADSLRVREVVAQEKIATALNRMITILYTYLDMEPVEKPKPKPYYQPPAIKAPEIHRRGL
tara:strand:+ start:1708 stop:1947 length:240 start_codon:yes stop_codon:yes gene_type:complete